MITQELPLYLADVPPGPEATRFTGTRLDGAPDGVHTGGVWFWSDKVWKPTDCRPYQNCPYRVETDEVAALTALVGQPLFPKNWECQQANGRRWIVRPICAVFGQTYGAEMDLEQLQEVRAGLRNANRLQWEVGDEISIGLDPEGRLFVVDMSCAVYRPSTSGVGAADDKDRFWRFARHMGFSLLRERHDAAGRARVEHFTFFDKRSAYVYGSYSRPLSRLWAKKLPEQAILVDEAVSNQITPHTWIFTDKPISPDVVCNYELTLCNEAW